MLSTSSERAPLPVIVALAGIGYGPGSDTEARALHAVTVQQKHPECDIIFTGAYPSTLRQRPPRPAALFMREAAIRKGTDRTTVHTEATSLTTIENALRVKSMLLPRQSAYIVTSDSHMNRTLETFQHIWGEEHSLIPEPSGKSHESRQGLQEIVGNFITNLVLYGTATGDDKAIAYRHSLIFPGEGPDRIFSPLTVVANAGSLACRTVWTPHQVGLRSP